MHPIMYGFFLLSINASFYYSSSFLPTDQIPYCRIMNQMSMLKSEATQIWQKMCVEWCLKKLIIAFRKIVIMIARRDVSWHVSQSLCKEMYDVLESAEWFPKLKCFIDFSCHLMAWLLLFLHFKKPMLII